MPGETFYGDASASAVAEPELTTGRDRLDAEKCLQIYRLMVRARIMEERMIKMSKSGEGFFWIGGPGEEAFNACLGLQVKKGHGPSYDFLHLHYRNSATMLAMGMPMADAIRQMAMTATDPFSRGRNFPGHFSYRAWNVIPISSVIEIQYAMAPGTAMVQKRLGGDGITIVTGGEAGSAEGDFATCMVWSSRPANELPVLMIITNNAWGISTPACTQHGEQHVIDRGQSFGIPGQLVDGNDPVASWHAIRRTMEYCRVERKPCMLEPTVSRLYGHSSSSGALRVKGEKDCIELFERRLSDAGLLDSVAMEQTWDEARAEAEAALEQALREPKPTAEDVNRFTYADSPVDVVYPGDYTGLPQRL